MALDDMINIESAFVAAATATALSSRGRNTIRQGAVYGVAGALKVGDVVVGAARGAVRGVRGDETAVSDAAADPAGGSRSQNASSPSSSRSRAASSSGARRTPRRTSASSPAQRTAAGAQGAETDAGA